VHWYCRPTPNATHFSGTHNCVTCTRYKNLIFLRKRVDVTDAKLRHAGSAAREGISRERKVSGNPFPVPLGPLSTTLSFGLLVRPPAAGINTNHADAHNTGELVNQVDKNVGLAPRYDFRMPRSQKAHAPRRTIRVRIGTGNTFLHWQLQVPEIVSSCAANTWENCRLYGRPAKLRMRLGRGQKRLQPMREFSEWYW
jgi:hypothetical protein